MNTKIMFDVSEVDWSELVKQKRYLMNSNNPFFMEGLINMIDTIQDRAADVLGEEKVFGKEDI